MSRWRRPEEDSRRERLDRMAAIMRQRNLTHGTGCKSTARAIAKRESSKNVSNQ